MENIKESKKRRIFKEVKDWIICIIIAVIATVLINKFLIYKVYIPSSSMVPTLNKGDQLFVTKVYNPEKLKTGDIVVFYSRENKDTYIKRLIGCPGDNVKIEKGVVYVNDKKINEDYVVYDDETFSGEYNVPQGKYFFLGDNRPVSNDSRKWDNPFVDEDDIEAKALLKVYPFKDFGLLK